ncbi:uncharacterized protein LOC117639965 isoform X2 [Thrips palmi]|uniref:Uncharacterized protein LOC117639965 isoform X2 n=1 Tax=Thrips palmi TaxID=161013 RepID=A0A6P8Y620_THRPL|nr:uncharacterized protein LOC117639965 isoform X2 [Thrips palmi]
MLILILQSGGSHFLQDLIAFGPFALSTSVIDSILSADELSPQKSVDVEFILNLSKSCFRRMTLNTSESAVILEKFFNYLVLFQNYGYSSLPNDKPYPCMNEDLKKGLHYINNLHLYEFTLKENVTLDQGKCWEGYAMRCATSNDSAVCKNLQPRSVDELIWSFRSVIISNLNKLLRELTVDNWMGMAEVTYYNGDKTLQRTLGEKTFQFLELLEKLSDDPRLPDLPAYLEAAMPFAMKPELKVEKTEDLSMDEMKSRFSCPVGRSSKLMKLFLTCPDIFQDDEKLGIIRDNCDLLDKSDVELILFSVVQILKEGNVNPSQEEILKSLSYQSTKYLTLENILEVKHNYLHCFGMESYLSGSQFIPNLLGAFNKLSFEQEDISEEWRCELIRLFILDPASVITKALQVGVKSPTLQRKIAEALFILKPESQTIIHGWVSELTDCCQFIRSEMDAFPKFALELWRKDILCKEEFLRKQVISGICKAMFANDWNMISMWITSMQFLLEEIINTSGKVGSIAVLLVYIGQVLEYCQQSIEEFNWGCMSVRGQALKIIQFLKCFQLSELEKDWFQCYIRKYSGMTLGQLEVFSSDDHPAKTTVNYGLCFNAQVKTSEFAAYILAEMLSFLLMDEWCGVADALKNLFAEHNDCSYSVFQSFQKSIMLLVAACGNVDLNVDSPHRSCLDFCVRCLGTVLKTKILPDLKMTNYLVVLEETLHLLCKLPSKVWNESGMHILPVVVDLMNKVPPQIEALNTLSTIIMNCPVNQSRELLEDKLKVIFEDAISEVSEVEMNDR